MKTNSDCIPLKEIITKTIENSPQKRITFAEYMALVLYYPEYGYYNSEKIKIGSQGDFFTSSSLSKDFGELLAIQLVEMWEILDKPSPFMLVEMGAGNGNLANDILTYCEQEYPHFLACLKYIIIEESTSLINQQQNQLEKWQHKNVSISWQNWDSIEDKSIVGCFFSNELIDAFPVHKVIKQDNSLQEIYVTIENESFREISGDLSINKINEYFDLIDINLLDNNYPEGYETEVNISALDWLKKVNAKLKQGYLLTIDYGYIATKYYHPQRQKGTLKCYYQHHHHDNPYINIGHQDLTTHLNFTALESQGKNYGLETLGFTKQAIFLMCLGLGDRLASLSSGNISFGEIMKRRDYLHQLINPHGLGNFGILIQQKGLNEIQKKRVIKGLKIPSNQL